MSNISASMVKTLRDATGLGMMECKKALVESQGDFDKARDLLRIKSGVKADKVAQRAATEGRIAFAQSGNTAALVEISCETDFVARDENIVELGNAIAQAVAANGSVPADIANLTLSNGDTVETARQNLVMKVGENIGIARAKTLQADGGAIHSYTHTGAKVACMVASQNLPDDTARGICMHIAAMRPRYVAEQNVPQDVLDSEMAIYTAQAQESGKPADIAQKMAQGKLKKYLAETTLYGQKYVVGEEDKTVGQVAQDAGGTVTHFELFVVAQAD